MESKERERIQEGNYPNILLEKKFCLILMEIRMSKFTKFIRKNIIVYFILL